MADPHNRVKAAKKAAKAQAKAQKKLAKKGGLEQKVEPHGVGAPPQATDSNLSAAERSARAAERQMVLQQYRVWISLVIALIALASFLVTVRPWKWLGESEPPSPPAATTDDS